MTSFVPTPSGNWLIDVPTTITANDVVTTFVASTDPIIPGVPAISGTLTVTFDLEMRDVHSADPKFPNGIEYLHFTAPPITTLNPEYRTKLVVQIANHLGVTMSGFELDAQNVVIPASPDKVHLHPTNYAHFHGVTSGVTFGSETLSVQAPDGSIPSAGPMGVLPAASNIVAAGDIAPGTMLTSLPFTLHSNEVAGQDNGFFLVLSQHQSLRVASSGGQTGRLLAGAQALVDAAGTNVVFFDGDYSKTIPAAAPGAVLAISSVPSGTMAIPSNYAAVVVAQGDIVTLRGGDAGLAVMSNGQLDYSGDAGIVDVFASHSNISDSRDKAVIGIAGTDMKVLLGGAFQTLLVDSGSNGTYVQTVGGGSLVIGSTETLGGTLAVGGASRALDPTSVRAAQTAALTILQLTSTNTVSMIDPGALSLVVLHGGGNTVTGTAGSNTIFASTGGDVYLGGAATSFFVGSTGSVVGMSTVVGGAGNVTVFAETGVRYTEGTGSNWFVGANQADLNLQDSVASATAFHSTVTATSGHDTLFGGTVGDQYNLGSGTETFVTGGGSDTISGGTTGPVVFGSTNENAQLIGTNAGVLVASGSNDTLDGSQASQGSQFWAVNMPGAGSSTLIGTPGAADAFAVASVTGGGGVAHTVSIKNFHRGDSFFLVNYDVADDASFATALKAHPGPLGDFSLTLSDKTTIQFVNTHPTAAFDGGRDAV